MTLLTRSSNFAWVAVLLAALAFAAVTDLHRWRRIEHVSTLTEAMPATDRSSATGYAGGVRQLLVPERNVASYQWIAQTQRMMADGRWRVQHVDFDNTPYGRGVGEASLYRWWLAVLARVDGLVTGRPAGPSVEHAALYADPLWHGLLILGATVFVAWQFGGWAAGLVAAGLAGLFPLAACFAVGQPDDHGLVLTLAIASELCLLVALRRTTAAAWWVLSGVTAGLAVWADVTVGVPFVLGIMLGGVGLESLGPSARDVALVRRWRLWSAAGAVIVLLGFLVDFYPGDFGSRILDTVHPAYGLAWLGASEWLGWWAERGSAAVGSRRGRILRLTGATLAIALVPIGMLWQHSRGFLTAHMLSQRLAPLPDTPTAFGLFDWVSQRGAGGSLLVTLLPLAVAIPALWLLTRARVADERRPAVMLALGPMVVALGFSVFRLRWWAEVDVALLGVAVALLAKGRPATFVGRAGWMVATAVALLFGLVRLYPRGGVKADTVSVGEAEALVVRDLAHWLRGRTSANPPAVLAPPELAAALSYYGGAQALSTPYRENTDGFAAAVRIAGATLPEEAYALVRRREITHIVIPSWDDGLDTYARLGADQPEKSFVNLLHQWLPPRWLRPVAYQMPGIPGFEGGRVVVYEVVDLQDDATSLSRLAEYFVETGDLDSAAKVADALVHWYPEDVGALVARAAVERARGNATGFSRCLTALEPSLGSLDDLPWERRVMLALVLAEARRLEAATEQLRRCFAEADDAKLRSLTTGTLFRVQVLARGVGLELPDAKLRQTAWALLPADLQEQLDTSSRAGHSP